MQIKKFSKRIRCYNRRLWSWWWNITKILSEAGLSVAVVEAGPYYDPANPEQMTQLKWA